MLTSNTPAAAVVTGAFASVADACTAAELLAEAPEIDARFALYPVQGESGDVHLVVLEVDLPTRRHLARVRGAISGVHGVLVERGEIPAGVVPRPTPIAAACRLDMLPIRLAEPRPDPDADDRVPAGAAGGAGADGRGH